MRRIVLAFCILFLCSSPSYAALRINDVAPVFSAPDLNGGTFVLRDALQSGRRVVSGGVVLSFFATWCGPCRNELPLLNELAADLQAKGVSVVIIDLKEDIAVIRQFIERLKLDRVTVLSDQDGKTAAHYQVRFLPTTFCIGADGMIKDMVYGEVRSSDEFRKCADKLLK
jgi:cytochrome c biogenesis protein CcmG, thiol:disulfide interchange protein DsbE